MDVMRQSVMGIGFILGHYCAMYPDETYPEERYKIVPQHPDVLYGRGTVSNYHPKEGDLYRDIDTNLTHLNHVLPYVRGTFNAISSWFVYSGGRLTGPSAGAREEEFGRPLGYYAMTKACMETMVESYCKTISGLPYRILRLSNVIGNDPRASKQKNALEMMLGRVMRGEMVEVYEGENWRDILHVEDTCRAIHLCINTSATLNSIINIGRGESHRMMDIVEYAIAKTGSRSEVKRVPVPRFHQIVQVSDFHMDVTKLTALGFRPQMTIWDSVDGVLERLS